jgi:trehalose-phosphatase
MREDVQNLVGIQGIFYAGSHGFDIQGKGFSLILPEAQKAMGVIEEIVVKLKNNLGGIKGILIEEKKFSVAVHYRLVNEEEVPKIKNFVDSIVKDNSSLRLMEGKKVWEILPAIDWNKGKAIRWIMQALKIPWEEASVIYLGDDTTDEDAFRVVRTRGTGVLVSREDKVSAADFRLSSPEEVKKLIEMVVESDS